MGKISLIVKIVVIVVVIVAAFFAISYFFPRQTSSTAGVTTAGYQAPEDLSASQLANKEFIDLLDKVSKIELDTSIIDNVIRKFEDFSPILPNIPAERPNPFAPIGVNREVGAPIFAPGATTTSQ